MADKDNSVGTLLAVFAVGALAGAAVALLLAPASGAETRRKLGEKARDGRAKADELAREARDLFKRQRENIATAVDRGREAFDQARGSKETL